MPTISQLPVASTLGAADLMVSVQAGVTSQITGSIVATFITNQLSLGSAAHVNVPIVPLNGGTGVASPTAHTIPIAEGTSNYNFIGPLSNGQLIIGSNGADPVAANLSAGSGISIATGAGSITISGTGSGIGWTDVTGSTQAMVADNGYVADRSSLITFTLPSVAAFGTALSVMGKGSGGWQINQNSGQNIQIGNVSSTVGAGGSIASSNRYDSITLICTTANVTWTALGGPQGAITIV